MKEVDLQIKLSNLLTDKNKEDFVDCLDAIGTILQSKLGIPLESMQIKIFDYQDVKTKDDLLGTLDLRNINRITGMDDEVLEFENWHYICSNYYLTEGVIRKFHKFIDWQKIADLEEKGIYKFSKKFIEEFGELLVSCKNSPQYTSFDNAFDIFKSLEIPKDDKPKDTRNMKTGSLKDTNGNFNSNKLGIPNYSNIPQRVDPKDPTIRRLLEASGIDPDSIPDDAMVFGRMIPGQGPSFPYIPQYATGYPPYFGEPEDAEEEIKNLKDTPIETMNDLVRITGKKLNEMNITQYREALQTLNFTPEFILNNYPAINLSILMQNPRFPEMMKNDDMFDRCINKVCEIQKSQMKHFRRMDNGKIDSGYVISKKRLK